MHDELLRRALESGKTTSKKAKSKETSPSTSRSVSKKNSRSASRIHSRDVSDNEDEGGNLSDETANSINSIDELLASDDFNEQTSDVLRQELRDRIEELTDRKGSSKQGREECLTAYIRILNAHLLADELYGKMPELVSAFSRSIKTEATQKEAKLALKALELTAISYADETLYESVAALLKRTISDSQSLSTKAGALHCLGTCLSFGGAGEEEIAETLTFLLEIVTSDGEFVNAHDSAEVVIAALQVWGFLATQVDDLEGESEDAVEAFLDQLDSADPDVQIAAGEDIALLYEKTFTPREEDEDSSAEEDADRGSSDDDSGDTSLIKRYDAYHNTHQVTEKVSELASLSTHKLSKNTKRKLHQSFASILATIENPRIGLRTNNARGMRVQIYQAGQMDVDSWWKLMRLNALRRLLAGGFVNHYFEGNKQVLDVLPIIMKETGANGSGVASPARKGAKQSKGKFRNERRFLDVPEI